MLLHGRAPETIQLYPAQAWQWATETPKEITKVTKENLSPMLK